MGCSTSIFRKKGKFLRYNKQWVIWITLSEETFAHRNFLGRNFRSHNTFANEQIEHFVCINFRDWTVFKLFACINIREWKICVFSFILQIVFNIGVLRYTINQWLHTHSSKFEINCHLADSNSPRNIINSRKFLCVKVYARESFCS